MSQRNRTRAQASSSANVSSQSQSSRRGNRTISPSSQDEDYEQFMVAAVKFILNRMATKYPLKRADLVKECCNGNTKIFSIILPTVQIQLKSVYGIILHEVSSVKGGNKQYICYAEKPSPSLLKLKKSDRQSASLLMLILSYLFVKGTPIGEGVLLNFLSTLGIDIDSEQEHDYFGEAKKYFETFQKQLYIKREKKASEASNEEKVTIEWGERALMEFDKKAMLVELAQMFQKPTQFFKKQHMELMIEPEDMEVDT